MITLSIVFNGTNKCIYVESENADELYNFTKIFKPTAINNYIDRSRTHITLNSDFIQDLYDQFKKAAFNDIEIYTDNKKNIYHFFPNFPEYASYFDEDIKNEIIRNLISKNQQLTSANQTLQFQNQQLTSTNQLLQNQIQQSSSTQPPTNSGSGRGWNGPGFHY